MFCMRCDILNFIQQFYKSHMIENQKLLFSRFISFLFTSSCSTRKTTLYEYCQHSYISKQLEVPCIRNDALFSLENPAADSQGEYHHHRKACNRMMMMKIYTKRKVLHGPYYILIFIHNRKCQYLKFWGEKFLLMSTKSSLLSLFSQTKYACLNNG